MGLAAKMKQTTEHARDRVTGAREGDGDQGAAHMAAGQNPFGVSRMVTAFRGVSFAPLEEKFGELSRWVASVFHSGYFTRMMENSDFERDELEANTSSEVRLTKALERNSELDAEGLEYTAMAILIGIRSAGEQLEAAEHDFDRIHFSAEARRLRASAAKKKKWLDRALKAAGVLVKVVKGVVTENPALIESAIEDVQKELSKIVLEAVVVSGDEAEAAGNEEAANASDLAAAKKRYFAAQEEVEGLSAILDAMKGTVKQQRKEQRKHHTRAEGLYDEGTEGTFKFENVARALDMATSTREKCQAFIEDAQVVEGALELQKTLAGRPEMRPGAQDLSVLSGLEQRTKNMRHQAWSWANSAAGKIKKLEKKRSQAHKILAE